MNSPGFEVRWENAGICNWVCFRKDQSQRPVLRLPPSSNPVYGVGFTRTQGGTFRVAISSSPTLARLLKITYIFCIEFFIFISPNEPFKAQLKRIGEFFLFLVIVFE